MCINFDSTADDPEPQQVYCYICGSTVSHSTENSRIYVYCNSCEGFMDGQMDKIDELEATISELRKVVANIQHLLS